MSKRSLVLVAVDGARETGLMAEFAVRIAKRRHADLRAVQVLPRVAGRVIEPADDVGLQAALSALRTAGEREGVRIGHVTLTGTPEHAIPAYAQLTRAAVVVVARDYGTSTYWRHSGVVRRLSRSSPAPVVVVPPRRSAGEAGPLSLKRIVAAVDFTVGSAVALRTAVELSRSHDARLTVLHAMSAPGHMVFSAGEAWRALQQLPADVTMLKQRLQRLAAAFGSGEVDPVVVTGEPSTAIAENAATSGADLVVIGVAPRSWVDELVFGSTLRSVLRRTRTPVLILPVVAGSHAWMDGVREAPDIVAAGGRVARLAA